LRPLLDFLAEDEQVKKIVCGPLPLRDFYGMLRNNGYPFGALAPA
jgi:hypothetical protein